MYPYCRFWVNFWLGWMLISNAIIIPLLFEIVDPDFYLGTNGWSIDRRSYEEVYSEPCCSAHVERRRSRLDACEDSLFWISMPARWLLAIAFCVLLLIYKDPISLYLMTHGFREIFDDIRNIIGSVGSRMKQFRKKKQKNRIHEFSRASNVNLDFNTSLLLSHYSLFDGQYNFKEVAAFVKRCHLVESRRIGLL